MSAASRRRDRETASVSKGIEHCRRGRKLEFRRDVMFLQAPAVVPLIQKKAGGTAFIQSQFEAQSLFAHQHFVGPGPAPHLLMLGPPPRESRSPYFFFYQRDNCRRLQEH